MEFIKHRALQRNETHYVIYSMEDNCCFLQIARCATYLVRILSHQLALVVEVVVPILEGYRVKALKFELVESQA